MGFSRKPLGGVGRSGFDQVSDYHTWPQPNVSYGQINAAGASYLRPTQDSALTRKTLLGTFLFLFALILFGFVTGYSLRGNAYAGANQSGLISLEMAPTTAPPGLDLDSARSQLIASIGSEAPDELVALDSAPDGSLSALIRLHSSGAGDSDRISLMRMDKDGGVDELIRQDAAGLRSMDMTRMTSGAFVTAILFDGVMEIRGIDSDGVTQWRREVLTADGHKAPVNVVAMPFATAVVGPSESEDRVALTYLGDDGELLWQRSFPSDPVNPDVRLVPNRDGSVFLAARNRAVTGQSTHSLIRVDREGQDVWRASMELDESMNKMELAASGDGGAYLLTTGVMPTLTKFGQFGDALWTSQMPHAKFFSNIHLVATSDGNAVTAVSYTISGERVDVLLEERSDIGEIIGETSLSLPASSSVEAVTEASPGQYYIGGSIQPDRFDDADVFVKDIKFQPVATYSSDALAEIGYSAIPANIVESQSSTGDVEVVSSDVPEITVASTPNGVEIESRRAEPVQNTQSTISRPRTIEPAVISAAEQNAVSGPENPNPAENQAALSRFVAFTEVAPITAEPISEPIADAGVRAQCRFSCLEAVNSSSVFPMWRAIEAPQSAYSSGLPVLHELTCEAAGGVMNASSPPDCQPY